MGEGEGVNKIILYALIFPLFLIPSHQGRRLRLFTNSPNLVFKIILAQLMLFPPAWNSRRNYTMPGIGSFSGMK